jgi:uncharacterized alpha/beta hydrolase family protein
MTTFTLRSGSGHVLAEIKVTPHIDKRDGEPIIDLLLMTEWRYDKAVSEQLHKVLEARYLKKRYGEWPE